MGIMCETGRAYVNIKEEVLGAEEIVRREDELLPKPRNMYHDFWVNVSNCKPVDKTQLTLQFWVALADKQIGESCEAVVVCFLLISLLFLGGNSSGCWSTLGVGFMKSLLSEISVPQKSLRVTAGCS